MSDDIATMPLILETVTCPAMSPLKLIYPHFCFHLCCLPDRFMMSCPGMLRVQVSGFYVWCLQLWTCVWVRTCCSLSVCDVNAVFLCVYRETCDIFTLFVIIIYLSLHFCLHRHRHLLSPKLNLTCWTNRFLSFRTTSDSPGK